MGMITNTGMQAGMVEAAILTNSLDIQSDLNGVNFILSNWTLGHA